MGSTQLDQQLDQLVHKLPVLVSHTASATHPWYDASAFTVAVDIAGLLAFFVGIAAWLWAIWRVRKEKSKTSAAEEAVAAERKRAARYQLVKAPGQLTVAERNVSTAISTVPADRTAVREALAALRAVVAETAEYLVTADVVSVHDGDRGELSVLLLLIDAAIGDLHDSAVSVSDATERIPIQLSSVTGVVTRIAVTITSAP